jgi:hypothetical protein
VVPFNKNPAKNLCSEDRFVCGVPVRPSVRPSGKWLVGPNSASNRATSSFISLGDTGRCYGVLLCRADASDQRRARYKALKGNRTLRLFRDTRPDLSFFARC